MLTPNFKEYVGEVSKIMAPQEGLNPDPWNPLMLFYRARWTLHN